MPVKGVMASWTSAATEVMSMFPRCGLLPEAVLGLIVGYQMDLSSIAGRGDILPRPAGQGVLERPERRRWIPASSAGRGNDLSCGNPEAVCA